MTIAPRKIFVLITLVIVFCACKKEEPNPEMFDPIYQDVQKKLKTYKGELATEEKNLETLEKEAKKVVPRTIEQKVSIKEVKKSRNRITDLRQKVKYYEIRSERRRVEGRRAYRVAFSKGEHWPNPKEFQNYLVHERLENAPMNWGLRVPKLDKNNPNFRKRSVASKEKGEEKTKE